MKAIKVILIFVLIMPMVSYAVKLVGKPLVSYNTPESMNLLATSQYKQDFLPLTQFFVTQQTLAYCGPASAVMVLNALKIEPPISSRYHPYRIFNQDNIFTPQVLTFIQPARVNFHGTTLAEEARVLNSFSGVSAKAYPADTSSLVQFRKLSKAALKTGHDFIIINFLRKALPPEVGGGHLSPIAAYNARTDMFLILDVSRYKYPPVWAPAKLVWQAMNTRDGTHYRGFIIAKKR